MEWFKTSEKIPEDNTQVLVWRSRRACYSVARYRDKGECLEESDKERPLWRFDAGTWAFVDIEDEWTDIPTRTDPITLGRSADAITIDFKFWNKVKDKKPPVGSKLLLGWAEEGEFFYTVARIEPHVDDPGTLMYTKHCGGLPDVLLTNHYWAEVPSIWPGLPAAALH